MLEVLFLLDECRPCERPFERARRAGRERLWALQRCACESLWSATLRASAGSIAPGNGALNLGRETAGGIRAGENVRGNTTGGVAEGDVVTLFFLVVSAARARSDVPSFPSLTSTEPILSSTPQVSPARVVCRAGASALGPNPWTQVHQQRCSPYVHVACSTVGTHPALQVVQAYGRSIPATTTGKQACGLLAQGDIHYNIQSIERRFAPHELARHVAQVPRSRLARVRASFIN